MSWRKREPRWRKRLAEMNPQVTEIRFPDAEPGKMQQDEEWAEVHRGEEVKRFRLHDYGDVYQIPGLYETIIYDRLQCCSPEYVVGLLESVLEDEGRSLANLRVLDIGAGNGMAGDELQAAGVGAVVGLDITPEAKDATLRDRPGVYDDYLIADLTKLTEAEEETLRSYRLNALTIVGALGFGDIPPAAFVQAIDLIDGEGWLAFNIEEGLLEGRADSPFAKLVRNLNQADVIQYWAYRRYRHRISIQGDPIYYMALVARKLRDLPDEILKQWL